MQESLYNTVKNMRTDKVNVEELEAILGTGIEEVVGLCKKACLKPKTDAMGNAYFTRNDVDTLKKIKELYVQSQAQEEQIIQRNEIDEAPKKPAMLMDSPLDSAQKKINFLEKAKSRMKQDALIPSAFSARTVSIENQLQKFEDSLIAKMSDILSEKMDGFDEIIVELIRSKTENENLRQQVNDLNKQLFVMKKELASYSPLPFGLYSKKETQDL